MKKIFALVLINIIMSGCYANEVTVPDTNVKVNEIHLDWNVPTKEYKLRQPDFQNDTDSDTYTDTNDCMNNNMPVDFMSAPLQMLRQYQSGSY